MTAERAPGPRGPIPFLPGAAPPERVRRVERAVAIEDRGVRAIAMLELVADITREREALQAAELLRRAPAPVVGAIGASPEGALLASAGQLVLAGVVGGRPAGESACRVLGVASADALDGLRDLAIQAIAPWVIERLGRLRFRIRPPTWGRLDLFSLGAMASPVSPPGELALEIGRSGHLRAAFTPDRGAARTVRLRRLAARAAPRLLTDDPLLARAIPQQVGLPARRRWRTMLTAAMGVVGRAAPWTARSPLLKALVPLAQPPELDGPAAAPRNARLRPESASLEDAPGIVYAGANSSAALLAEAIVHEVGHQELFLLERRVGPLWPDSGTQRLYSPWKDEPRPPRALLHGICSFLAVASFWYRLRGWGGAVAEIRFARALAQVELAIASMEAAPEPCPAGRELLIRFGDWHARLACEPLSGGRLARTAVDQCVAHASLAGVVSRGRFIRAMRGGAPP